MAVKMLLICNEQFVNKKIFCTFSIFDNKSIVGAGLLAKKVLPMHPFQYILAEHVRWSWICIAL